MSLNKRLARLEEELTAIACAAPEWPIDLSRLTEDESARLQQLLRPDTERLPDAETDELCELLLKTRTDMG